MKVEARFIANFDSIDPRSWDSIVGLSRDATVFQLNGWCDAWLRAHRSLYSATMIIGAYRNGELVGLAPLVIREGDDQYGTTVGFIGAPHADYLTFPCVDDSLDLIEILLDAIIRRAPIGATIALQEVPQFSSLALCLRQRASTSGTGVFIESTTACPRLRIKGNEEFVSSLRRKKSVRRHEKHLLDAGDVEFQHLVDPDLISPLLDELFTLHIERWRGSDSPSMFLNSANKDFFRQLLRSLAGAGRILYSRCILDGRPVSVHFGLVYRCSLIWYKPAFDLACRRHSPGEVLLDRLISHAVDNGIEILDFTRGREPFKFRFSSDVSYNSSFVVVRGTAGKVLNDFRRRGRALRNRFLRRRQQLATLRSTIAEALKGRPVLVLDGHSAAAVECTQSLGRLGVNAVVAAEEDRVAALGSSFIDRSLVQPQASDPEAFQGWLRSVVASDRHALIIPTTENSLLAINALGEGDPVRILSMIPHPQAVDAALDKLKTWQLAMRLGVRVPRARLIEADADEGDGIPFPRVLKPMRSMEVIDGEFRRMVPAIVRNWEERRAALAAMSHCGVVQEQEYVVGEGVGVECLYRHGQLVWCFVHERIHELPLTGGGSTYRRSIEANARAVRGAKVLLDALNWHGVAMVEFKRTRDGDYCLMEINPRFWGSLALALDAGVDFPAGVLLSAIQTDCGPQPDYDVGYFTRHLQRDVDWLKENLRADHGDPILLTRGRFRSLFELMRPLWLRESWDHFDWGDLHPVQSQLRAVLRGNLAGIAQRGTSWRARRKLRRRQQRMYAEWEKRPPISSILFVCYGNICRSAFAERYARMSGFRPTIESAGFHRSSGRRSPDHLVLAASRLGVDMSEWSSATIDAAMVARADLVVLMDAENFESFNNQFPESMDRVMMLALFSLGSEAEIPDPYSLSEPETREVLNRIRAHLDDLHAFVDRRAQP